MASGGGRGKKDLLLLRVPGDQAAADGNDRALQPIHRRGTDIVSKEMYTLADSKGKG